MDPLKEQIGGSHYKNFKMQPIELIAKTRCSFIQGNIVKYISRYKEKNGKQDLEKVIHYAKLALELGDKGNLGFRRANAFSAYCQVNNLSEAQTKIIQHTGWDNYANVIEECTKLIEKEYGS